LRAERFPHLRELFHELVDAPPEECQQRLLQLDREDPELAAELRELLAMGGEDEARVSEVIAGEARELAAGVGDVLARGGEGEQVGRRIGPWELVRLLGHGGMGAVYLARRADGAFVQLAALKLIRSGLASGQLVRRFRDERQVLASLDHPNIARLLDGGTTDDGMPYLVMEYVEGTTLEEHCDAHGLGVPDRLELVLAVCAGVEHAHRSLVVHRDLKPANILVTAAGVPKLLDFGVAKLLGPAPGDETLLLTRDGATVGTIAFASPEQLLGKPVTTATDVYSLGVVLYRLLTGRHPYALEGVPLAQAVRRVCEADPLPPSRAAIADEPAVARARVQQLRGDLDNIALKALQKDPGRRYPSMAALAEDLRRHRDGLPVGARPATWRYRAGKFVRRHRLGVAAAALVLLSLVGGLGAAAWSARRAEIERAKATQVSDFLAGMFSASNVGWRVRGGRGVTVAEVLSSASKRLGRDLEGQPEVEARLRHVLAESEVVLFEYERARRELERALVLDRQVLGENAPQTTRARALLGWVHTNRADLKRAVPLLDAAVAAYRRMPDPPPADFVEALGWRSYAALLDGHLDAAEPLAREAVALARRRLPNHPLLPQVVGGVGIVEQYRGDVPAAERSYREALRLFDRLPDPDLPERHFAQLYLGNILLTRGALAEAEPLLRGALADTERHLGPEDVLTVEPHYQLALWYSRRGELAKAEAELRRGLAIQRRHTPDSHPMNANGMAMLGRVLARQGRYAEGEVLLRQARSALAALAGTGWLLSDAESALAACLAAQGRFAEAEPVALGAFERLRGLYGDRHERTQLALKVVVDLYERWGKTEQRDAYAARVVPQRR
jgi:serine/threonine-protein kinase